MGSMCALKGHEPSTPRFAPVKHGILWESSDYLAMRESGCIRFMRSARTLPFYAPARWLLRRIGRARVGPVVPYREI